jgi:hypothetical protein
MPEVVESHFAETSAAEATPEITLEDISSIQRPPARLAKDESVVCIFVS